MFIPSETPISTGPSAMPSTANLEARAVVVPPVPSGGDSDGSLSKGGLIAVCVILGLCAVLLIMVCIWPCPTCFSDCMFACFDCTIGRCCRALGRCRPSSWKAKRSAKTKSNSTSRNRDMALPIIDAQPVSPASPERALVR